MVTPGFKHRHQNVGVSRLHSYNYNRCPELEIRLYIQQREQTSTGFCKEVVQPPKRSSLWKALQRAKNHLEKGNLSVKKGA